MYIFEQFYLRSSTKYTDIVTCLNHLVHFFDLLLCLSIVNGFCRCKSFEILVEFLGCVVFEELLLIFLFWFGCSVLESDVITTLRSALIKFERLLWLVALHVYFLAWFDVSSRHCTNQYLLYTRTKYININSPSWSWVVSQVQYHISPLFST